MWQTYLPNRSQSVRIGLHSSAPTVCTSGVPQGSVLGPLLFSTCTSPIAMITRSFHVCHQQYADDTQLFIALNPSDPSSDITKLTSCLGALQSWFCLNGMALKPDKSDAILFGTRQRSSCYTSLGCIHIDMSAGYRLFIRVKLVRVERSRSLVQAQTLVIQSPLKIWWKLWNTFITLNFFQKLTLISAIMLFLTVYVKIMSYLYYVLYK